MKKVLLSLTLASTLILATETQEFENEYKKDTQEDMFKAYNEAMTAFNDTLYKEVLTPISDGYKAIIPETPRDCISNFFDNLMFPIRFVNNLLQFKLINTLEETERFVINTTLGFGGIIDIAKNDLGIQKHNEDFGQTLGFYGLPSGEHIVLPILGPSNVRDIFGLGGDYFLNPLSYTKTDTSIALNSEMILNNAPKNLEDYKNLTKDVVELYPFLKESYESYRINQIKH